jgi:hypothetical protein
VKDEYGLAKLNWREDLTVEELDYTEWITKTKERVTTRPMWYKLSALTTKEMEQIMQSKSPIKEEMWQLYRTPVVSVRIQLMNAWIMANPQLIIRDFAKKSELEKYLMNVGEWNIAGGGCDRQTRASTGIFGRRVGYMATKFV